MPDDRRLPDRTFSKNDIDQFRKQHNITTLSNDEIKLEIIKLSDVTCKNQPWFWPGFIPDHTVTVIAGNGGVGKSALLLYIAAKTTSGEKINYCGFEVTLPKSKVIIMSAEDDPEYQLKPKLLAAGVNQEMIDLIKCKTIGLSAKKKLINLQNDLDAIEKYIEEQGNVRLIIIDPVSYFVGDLREDRNSEVIYFLDMLKDFAKKHNLAIILNKHLRKKGTNSGGAVSASSEIGGSAAWVTSPRITWIISNDHDNPNIKIISNPKNNLANTQEECLAYQINESTFSDKGIIFKSNTIIWEGRTYRRNADEALSKEQYQKSATNTAIEFIYKHLRENGVSLYKTIYDAALYAGMSDRQMRAAKKHIKDNCRDEISIKKAKYCNGDELTLLDQ
jgi:putative DNA primase/helicase